MVCPSAFQEASAVDCVIAGQKRPPASGDRARSRNRAAPVAGAARLTDHSLGRHSRRKRREAMSAALPPIATKFWNAAKCREVPKTEIARQQLQIVTVDILGLTINSVGSRESECPKYRFRSQMGLTTGLACRNLRRRHRKQILHTLSHSAN